MKKLTILTIFLSLLGVSFAQDLNGITGEGKTKDGVKVGKWTYVCDSTGKEVGVERYDGDGKLHGYQTWYSCDGYRISEYNYEHGVKMGTQKDYYEYGNRLKREWSLIEQPKKCKNAYGDKGKATIESYKEYFSNGKVMIEMKGDPCGKRMITKNRPSGGQEWTIRYDDQGQWIDGPRIQEQEIFSQDLY